MTDPCGRHGRQAERPCGPASSDRRCADPHPNPSASASYESSAPRARTHAQATPGSVQPSPDRPSPPETAASTADLPLPTWRPPWLPKQKRRPSNRGNIALSGPPLFTGFSDPVSLTVCRYPGPASCCPHLPGSSSAAAELRRPHIDYPTADRTTVTPSAPRSGRAGVIPSKHDGAEAPVLLHVPVGAGGLGCGKRPVDNCPQALRLEQRHERPLELPG